MGTHVPWTFDRTGSHVALDLANTVSGRKTGRRVEHLTEWGRVVDFAEQVGAIGPDAVPRWRAWGERHPDEAAQATASAQGLRDALYEVFFAVSEGRTPDEAALATLNRWITHLELAPDFTWRCCADHEAPEAILMPVVRTAVDLLTSPQRHRVRTCDADDCAWLFLDLSKNGSRRWCDMTSCGNRAKSKRFRQKGSGPAN